MFGFSRVGNSRARRSSRGFRPECEPLPDRILPSVVSFRQETGADLAQKVFGVTGKGTAIVLMDRGIDYTDPDFIKPDGTTRIRWMLDLTGQNYNDPNNPPGVEYSEAQINAALHGGPPLAERDAVGHGTLTAGIAAGNGRAFADGKYRGMAPDADLVIVKLVSDGAPAHGDQPAEAPFVGNITQALDWVDQKLTALHEPAVGLMNFGTQAGPIDGTSVISHKIDQVFGSNRPGRIYVSSSGDEGDLPDHAGGGYSNTADTAVHFSNTGTGAVFLQLWYSGNKPANVSLRLDDGTTVGPIGPGQFYNQDGIFLGQYTPGQEPYPYTSTSGDYFVGIVISGHTGGGTLQLRGLSDGSGRFDVYAGNEPQVSFTDHVVPGRLDDTSSTRSAIVVGAYTLQTTYTDIDGISRTVQGDKTGALWSGSSGGPTRDGREFGVDITTPGENVFASYARNSYWATFRFNLIQDGGGWYGRQGATSGAAPIAVGALALMLQEDPALTAEQAREILRATAREDNFTGETPNVSWGYGKLNVFTSVLLAALAGRHPERSVGRHALLVPGSDSPVAPDLAGVVCSLTGRPEVQTVRHSPRVAVADPAHPVAGAVESTPSKPGASAVLGDGLRLGKQRDRNGLEANFGPANGADEFGNV
jgi:hypothetical protein